jgi:TonB family protein
MRAVRAHLATLSLLAVCLVRCAAPAAPPEPAPEPPPPAPVAHPAAREPARMRVTATSLNVRREPSTSAEVVTQARKSQVVFLLEGDASWSKVRLDSGETGWVATRFIELERIAQSRKVTLPKKKKSGCPADSDYAFVDTPTLAFSDSGAHGLVVVEANVNTKGDVTSTKVVRNETGDEALAFLAQREIKAARFSPPIRNCVARAFVFTYRRTF